MMVGSGVPAQRSAPLLGWITLPCMTKMLADDAHATPRLVHMLHVCKLATVHM
jgi:hypothetical protein